jgi:hypothetical protein
VIKKLQYNINTDSTNYSFGCTNIEEWFESVEIFDKTNEFNTGLYTWGTVENKDGSFFVEWDLTLSWYVSPKNSQLNVEWYTWSTVNIPLDELEIKNELLPYPATGIDLNPIKVEKYWYTFEIFTDKETSKEPGRDTISVYWFWGEVIFEINEPSKWDRLQIIAKWTKWEIKKFMIDVTKEDIVKANIDFWSFKI